MVLLDLGRTCAKSPLRGRVCHGVVHRLPVWRVGACSSIRSQTSGQFWSLRFYAPPTEERAWTRCDGILSRRWDIRSKCHLRRWMTGPRPIFPKSKKPSIGSIHAVAH